MSYLDTEEQVLKMLSKLVDDIITNTATGNFRFKADFQGYVDNLPNEYKTQVKKKEDNNRARTGTRTIGGTSGEEDDIFW